MAISQKPVYSDLVTMATKVLREKKVHAHLHIVLYKYVKFHWNWFTGLGGVLRTKFVDARQTDRQTDIQTSRQTDRQTR